MTDSTRSTQSSDFLGRGTAAWSNPVLRQGLLLIPLTIEIALQGVAGNLSGQGRYYLAGVLVLSVATVLAWIARPLHRRWNPWLVWGIPLLDLAGIGLMRMVPEGNGLGLLSVLPAIWLGMDKQVRGVVVFAVGTTTLVMLPVVTYFDFGIAAWSRGMQIVAVGTMVSLTTAWTSTAWANRAALLRAQGVELAEALERSKEARALNEAIVAAVDVGLVSIDREGTYNSMNPRHTDFMELAYPDGHGGIAGQKGWVFAEDNQTLVAYDDMPTVRAVRGEQLQDYLIWVGRVPEDRRALAVSSRAVEADDGPGGHVLVYKDVTELVTALQVKDEFVASVSHELRTPLTSIIGYLDLSLHASEPLPVQTRKQLEIVRRNSARLLRLVNDLLLSAQADQGHMALDVRALDLGQVLRDCADQMTARADAAGVELRTHIDEGITVEADELRIAEVADNLVNNAIKYCTRGGIVSVGVHRHESGGSAIVTVTDTGIGISPGDQDQLFTRFFRTQEAQQRAIQGAGLGLAITKSIVESHGGAIDVRSVVGEGTTFTVTLPTCEGPAATRDAACSEASLPSATVNG